MRIDEMYLNEENLSEVLSATADELDIPQDLYEEATLKYEEVGVWLANDTSGVAEYLPEIYPQGSFRLGTAVRPINEGCDYDIDLVCRLDIEKQSISQVDLKTLIGDRLRESNEYRNVLTPSRRCWNLNFPKQFHMDVLPSIPNADQAPDGILLTDTELRRWQKSHPKAYAAWFYSKMATQFLEQRSALAKSLAVSIEDVPEWRVKTPLQRAVQLLKRHRDVMFQDDSENRPISIIITTLAAHAYRGEPDVFRALIGLAERMPAEVQQIDGIWWVRNPVEPDENFADKWNEVPARRRAFIEWLAQVRKDVLSTRNTKLQTSKYILERSFGATAVKRAEDRLERSFGIIPSVMAKSTSSAITAQAPHALPPSWPVQEKFKVTVKGSVYLKKNGKRIGELSQRRLPKYVWLRFFIETNAPGDYAVKWQVVNTGEEATANSQLRGDFYDSETVQSKVRWETVRFKGVHWVEAFVVKDGVCVARSGRRYVLVK